MALDSLAPDVWSVHRPLRFFGVQLGTRMTVVRLLDGTLLLHSPIEIDDALMAELDALGPVGHIIAPSLFHHLYVGEAASRYPDARVLGAPGLLRKRRDVTFDAILGDEPDPSWQGELLSVPIEGSTLGETVLFHERSGTLISADVIENFAESSDWVTRAYLKAGGIYGKPGIHPLLRLSYRDKKSARRSFDRLLELPIGPIALAHGDPLLADGLQALRETYAWLL